MKETLTIQLLKEAEDGSMASNEVYSFSRQEAIERMAKAFFYAEFENADEGWKEETWSSKTVKETFCKQSEAALNALLEGK